ncbi:E3 Ubiquitin ligase [Cynara cardunculus var. scolymus]|uniref:RING-type E3 ubiquitin transferase n=1 Tax=Cynara cardunculus var. scolymus TaxID=59895 RepID=A0A118JWD5_CYNCS|nr:E3 Ubiquitin ligase [Cynara cardunculus var. scolymus]
MIPWGGVTCCLSAAALYLLGRNSGKDAEILKSVTRVNQLKDLAQLLDAANKVLPFVVTISGRVSSDTPINCEYSGLRGVIVEETAEQHFLKHNDAGSWIQDSALMLSMCKEVPWYLDDGSARVYVVGARGAAGLVLTVGSEVFEESGRSLVRGTLDYLQGLKMLGVKRIERVLPTGTPLTVVGEAIKDDVGTVRIQRPLKGPFYVSHKTIDQLIANLGKWARVLDAAARRPTPYSEGSNGEAENGGNSTRKDVQMPDICVICLEQEYNSVWSYVLLYDMLFKVDILSTMSNSNRAGGEDLPSLSNWLLVGMNT